MKNKGSITHFVKGKTAHRFPKVVTLAVSSCVLVTMVAIDASASTNTPNIAGPSTHTSVIASESSLFQLFGLGRHRLTPITSAAPASSPVTTVAAGGGGTSGGGGGGTSGGGGGGGGGTSGGGGGGGGTTTTASPATTTTTAPPTNTPSAPSSASGGLITAGPSRKECLITNTATPNVAGLDAAVSSFDAVTGTNVTCVGSYLDTAQTWTDWSSPWIVGSAGDEYTDWVAQDPQVRQLTLQVDLIPASLEDTSDPLGWEQSCDAGDFNSYATELGQNLVAAGLQNSVIRLGAEMNGPWEVDFMGTTTQEQNDWASCFANEVTAMRQASGEHFLFDWNPNACYENVPFANYYPGNAYVDILGLDLYDVGCDAPTTALTFSQLASEPGGLTSIDAFASAQGKPMSFPEWGLASSPSGDDPGYVNGIGSTVDNGDVAFQEYFNLAAGGTILLGANTPLSNAAYQKMFANS